MISIILDQLSTGPVFIFNLAMLPVHAKSNTPLFPGKSILHRLITLQVQCEAPETTSMDGARW